LEWFIKRVFDSVHEVCRIPAGAGGIRHSVALAIKYYPVIFIKVVPHPILLDVLGRELYFLVSPQDIYGVRTRLNRRLETATTQAKPTLWTIINNSMKIPNGLSIGKVWRGG
jgi:hypothetical protein